MMAIEAMFAWMPQTIPRQHFTLYNKTDVNSQAQNHSYHSFRVLARIQYNKLRKHLTIACDRKLSHSIIDIDQTDSQKMRLKFIQNIEY